MPPLKEALPRNFSREASGILTMVGHGRLLVIGDSSLDIPDRAQYFYYLGNTEGDISAAAAFKDLQGSCPIDEGVTIRYMEPDSGLDAEVFPAPKRNASMLKELGYKALGYQKGGPSGFYEFSKGTDPTKPPIYCLTASSSAFDCIAATIGHSQV